MNGLEVDRFRTAIRNADAAVRRSLLRLALGRWNYELLTHSLAQDKRTGGARLVDIVVRQDAVEKRFEADWVRRVARILTPPPVYKVARTSHEGAFLHTCEAAAPKASSTATDDGTPNQGTGQ